MNTITCCNCLKSNNEWKPQWDIHNNDYASSLYQVEKKFKHGETGHYTGNHNVSLISIPENYDQYMKETLVSGHFEVDHLGRKNYLLYYDERMGDLYNPPSGIVIKEEKFFKVVKPETPTGVHGFSFDLYAGIQNSKCHVCGCDLWNSSSISK